MCSAKRSRCGTYTTSRPSMRKTARFPARCACGFRGAATARPSTPDGDSARIVFEDAVRAPAKGQSAVLYDGDIVIGGGFII
ncbi:MAG: aminomethyltransferase beta-barrel domain-containing protein [Agathobaculum sp.]